MTLRVVIYAVLMWATLIYAMRRGGRTERSAAWIIVIVSVLSGTVASSYTQVIRTVLIYDILGFLAFFAIGLFSRHYWPMWIAALSGMTVLGHLLPMMPLSNPWVYRQAIVLWSWPTLLIIIGAVYQRSREAKANVSSSA
jgi:peptidoglycan/LPS O-acetylase OafA/YrhL